MVFHLFNIAVTASILVVASLIHDASAQQAHGCIRMLQEGDFGNFESQGYPKGYNSNQYCVQTIKVRAGKAVQLRFNDFAVQRSPGCQFDSVKLYDGPNASYPLLATYCGFDNPPDVFSSGNILSLVFQTDGTDGEMSSRGFTGMYRMIDIKKPNTTSHPIVKIGDRVTRCIDDVNDQSDGTVKGILSSDKDFILVRVEWDSQNVGDYNITTSMPRQCAEPEVLSTGGQGNGIEPGVILPN